MICKCGEHNPDCAKCHVATLSIASAPAPVDAARVRTDGSDWLDYADTPEEHALRAKHFAAQDVEQVARELYAQQFEAQGDVHGASVIREGEFIFDKSLEGNAIRAITDALRTQTSAPARVEVTEDMIERGCDAYDASAIELCERIGMRAALAAALSDPALAAQATPND